jgi:hypothetical protein
MSKTPEQMAEECKERVAKRDIYALGTMTHREQAYFKEAFLAGYQAAAPQWVSVKDRLPEPLQDVLIVYAPTNEVRNDFRMECWNWPENPVHETQFVTHWQPLPEPPKEKK